MPDEPNKNPPPDQAARERALDVNRSILVRAPAGSGKTDLLTRRFLRLLGEVDDPGQIVAITFTKAAAAEMRHRILSELENADGVPESTSDRFTMQALAQRALTRSEERGWNLLDLPAQLRISTIDSFCRDLALQQPLLSRLGDGLDIAEQPRELYRRAARQTLERIDEEDAALSQAIEDLLLWRDNSWQDLEDQLVTMLEQRDRWMREFVVYREQDWERLRVQLERPFARAGAETLNKLSELLDRVPGAREEALELARFACEEPGANSPWGLAECTEIPVAPFSAGLDSAQDDFLALAAFLQTQKGGWRSEKGLKASDGFPPTPRGRAGKTRFASLISTLDAVPGLESALAAVRELPSTHYSDEDWRIVRACFELLRQAAGELEVVFAEAAAVDYIEVAQLALNVLKGEDGLPTDAAMAVADGIRYLLVDEFQDTSRRQHQLLAYLIAAWPEREGRACFVVGDPMQSIYFFRDADAELFPRVEQIGLEIPGELPLRFEPVQLQANFRSAPPLIDHINDTFAKVFAVDDGSGIAFAGALPARNDSEHTGPHLVAGQEQHVNLHFEFMPQSMRGSSRGSGAEQKAEIAALREAAREKQTEEIVAFIRSHMARMDHARAAKEKYRIAVLGRARKSLAPIAKALREAKIPFRAVELEKLEDRPEILDALALARALLNPQDRVAWLGVLRAPWCGLSLADLHTLAGDCDAGLLVRPVPELLAERAQLLSSEGRTAVERMMCAIESAERLRFAQTTVSLGTWLEQVWLRLGGAHCVDATARANLDLLWCCFDSLPDGEPDLLGPAIDAALEKLTALPDANAESDCGVQLMTIHKAKGLEFEVVIVPDLQAGAGRGKPELLSWLERGLPPEVEASEPYASGAITEFLVAPFQCKGADRGKAKIWVDDERREREKQETRRLLYVAATRAREELHWFARPEYKTEKDGTLSLAVPQESLLKTAWPALKEEVQARFDEWISKIAKPEAESALPSTIDAIAASGEDNLLPMRPCVKAVELRRLPPHTRMAQEAESVTAMESGITGWSANRLYERHEGGLLSRALGIAVHAHFQHLAQLLATQPLEAARAPLTRLTPRIAAEVRAIGVDPKQANRIAAHALEITLKAASEPVAQWILAPHAEAASEVRWTGVVDGSLRTVQMDRVFRAGPTPKAAGQSADKDTWWIIDYKTAHDDDLDAAGALPELRRIFAPQIEAYAKVLRNLHGADARVHGGLYYPRMTILDWWEL
jgi:ATP-dependent exoDNAse (exonuclease V) beta subunit